MARNLLAAFLLFSLTLVFLLVRASSSPTQLDVHYYKQTCPKVEKYVREAVKKAIRKHATVPAGLLRLHFHDCFIRGCDASVLIDSTPGNEAEKDGPPNVSLHGFFVIDNAKAKIEAACPKVVSCADILAIAARDAVVLSGGPHWEVLKGRKDGRISNASETRNLPSPAFNVSQLTQSFALRNLSQLDLVTLSGGHTIGFSHCSSFNQRLFNFNATAINSNNNSTSTMLDDEDPSLSHRFATTLRRRCPIHNTNRSAGAFLDSSSTIFDNKYYKDIVARKAIFSSDQALLDDPQTQPLVSTFAQDPQSFFANFAQSMVNMGNVDIKTDEEGEVRLNCRVVNPSSS